MIPWAHLSQVGSDGPKESCVRWGPDPPWEGAIWRGEKRPIVKYRDARRSSVQKRLNRSICCLGCGLGWAEGSMSSIVFARWRQCAQFQSYSPGGADIPDDTLPWAVQTAEPIDLLFGLRTRMGRRKHKFSHIRQVVPMCPYGRAHWCRMNRPFAVAMLSYVKLLWPLVIIVPRLFIL